MTQQEFEDMIIQVVANIYDSSVIPESHKPVYIEHILNNGLTEKMAEELEKTFAKDAEILNQEILDQAELTTGLEAVLEKEQALVDRPQAEIVAAIDIYADRQVDQLNASLQQIEQDFQDAFEETAQESEHSEEEAIRQKLGLK